MTSQKSMDWSNIGFAQKAFGVLLAVVVACVIFVTPHTIQPNLMVYGADVAYFVLAALVGVGFFGGSQLLIQRFKLEQKLTRTTFCLVLLVASLALLMLQGVIFYQARFVSGWDVIVVTFLNRGGTADDPFFQYYVSLYPNQTFLEAFNYVVSRLAAVFGIQNSYSILVLINIVLVNLSCALLASSVAKLVGRCTGLVAWLAAACFLGLSPWILVPYSDTAGLFCSALMLAVYVLDSNWVRRYLFVGLITAVAMAIKPPLLAFGGCIAFLTAVKLVRRLFLARGRTSKHASAGSVKGHTQARAFSGKEVLPLVLIVVGFALGSLVVAGVKRTLPVQPNGVSQAGMAHYLMMGHNEEREGGYSQEDIDFTQSFSTPQERNAADLQRFTERVEHMGPTGLLKLYSKKLATMYSDGSFMWMGEGSFVTSMPRDTVIAKFFGIGNTTIPYTPVAQLMWYCTLIGCILSCFVPLKGKISVQAMVLSLMALTLFLMLFECRARYLLQMSPYFVVLSVLGWSHLIKSQVAPRL